MEGTELGDHAPVWRTEGWVVSDDVRIDFFALFPLTRAEMDLKLQKGMKALLDKLVEGEVYTEMIDVGRRSVV